MNSDEVLIGILRSNMPVLNELLAGSQCSAGWQPTAELGEQIVDAACKSVTMRDFEPFDKLADYLLDAAQAAGKLHAADTAVCWLNLVSDQVNQTVDRTENLSRDQRVQMHMRVKAIFSFAIMRIAQHNLRRLL